MRTLGFRVKSSASCSDHPSLTALISIPQAAAQLTSMSSWSWWFDAWRMIAKGSLRKSCLTSFACLTSERVALYLRPQLQQNWGKRKSCDLQASVSHSVQWGSGIPHLPVALPCLSGLWVGLFLSPPGLPYVPLRFADFNWYPFALINKKKMWVMAFLSFVIPSSESLNLIVALGTSQKCIKKYLSKISGLLRKRRKNPLGFKNI